jgi:hypothetical protein
MFFLELVRGFLFVFTYKFYLCLLKPSSVILLPRCIVENISVKIHVLKCVTFYYWLLIEICLMFNILAHAKDSAPVESHPLHMALQVPSHGVMSAIVCV